MTAASGGSDAAAPCVGLACKQQKCPGTATTSLSGTVFAPNGTLPVYDATVYIPNGPIAPMTSGISCDPCGSLPSGDPLAVALTDSSGHFSIANIPVAANLPLVIQIGKWRRQTTISTTITACVDNPITDPNVTRLPKNQSEGNMPHIALTTGDSDQVGCVLPKLGIDSAEFGVQTDGPTKAVHVYSPSLKYGQTDGFTNTSKASTLWADASRLQSYDLAIFSDEGEITGDATLTYGAPSFKVVTDYLNAGGRLLTVGDQYIWYQDSPDPELGIVDAAAPHVAGFGVVEPDDPAANWTLLVDETFPKGVALGQWLTSQFPANPLVDVDGGAIVANMGGAGDYTGNGVAFSTVAGYVASVTTKARSWAGSSGQASNSVFTPRVFSLNTPAGLPSAQQCGKSVYMGGQFMQNDKSSPDFVGCQAGGKVGDASCYPTTCTGAFGEDEAMLAFFFFEVSSCVQNDGYAPVPPVLSSP